MEFLSFPSIEGLHNVVRAIEQYPHIAGTGVVKYRGKIKLHGTNAGVQIGEGQVVAQSRTQIITPENDNAGFARWVESRKDFFSGVGRSGVNRFTAVMPPTYTVFGEWCGPGIMKGTAINGIPTKVFAIFAVMMGTVIDPALDGYDASMITDPEAIKQLLGDSLPSDIHVLPWQGDEFTLNYADREGLQKEADRINGIIAEIEPADPWVKATFGVDGISEGIVYVPGAGEIVTRKYYSDLAFKAKGEKHKVVKTKEAVQIDPEVAKSIGEFVTLFATEARFEQGVAALSIAFDTKNIGQFLKWLGQDVQKESADELEASGLEWGQVEKGIQMAARNWFIGKARAL